MSIRYAVFDPNVQGVSAAYNSANLPVPCATSKGIPSIRYNLSPNFAAKILPICKVSSFHFCDTFILFHIQIPPGAVLPASLRCKETRIVTHPFHRQKAKNSAGADSVTVPTPALAVFSYIKGYFASKSMKNLLCLGRQKRVSDLARREGYSFCFAKSCVLAA